MSNAIAIDHGDTVILRDSEISYTLTKKEYTTAKDIVTNGIEADKLSRVITPHDIVGYLNESNPEAQSVRTEVAVQRALKNKVKDNAHIIAIGGTVFICALAVIMIYLVIGRDTGGAAAAAQTAAQTAAVSVT